MWWKNHACQFPLLAEAARRVLCIPASSAPVERVFSTSGLPITKLRNRLTEDNASDIIFLRSIIEELSDELHLDNVYF
jgi:hypothetical protein